MDNNEKDYQQINAEIWNYINACLTDKSSAINHDEYVSVHFFDEDLWLTQSQIAEIYDTTKQNVGLHIKNILEDGELEDVSVVKKFFTTATDVPLSGAK